MCTYGEQQRKEIIDNKKIRLESAKMKKKNEKATIFQWIYTICSITGYIHYKTTTYP